MLTQLVTGFWVDPEKVAVVRETDDDGKCVLFLEGQSAVDGGFTLNYPAEQVAQQVNEACDELYSEENPVRDDEEEE